MTAAPHSPAATDTEGVSIGIAEMAESSGLTQDTLRWYEREGLIPEIPRTAMGRRAFSPRLVALVKLLVRLRSTGMPTADMRLAEARSALETKISHYENLIAQGLDCDGLAVVPPSANEHRSIHVDFHS